MTIQDLIKQFGEGEWIEWTGEYEKQEYICKHKDTGEIYECWPNAGVMTVISGADVDAMFGPLEVSIWVPANARRLITLVKNQQEQLKVARDVLKEHETFGVTVRHSEIDLEKTFPFADALAEMDRLAKEIEG